VLRLILSVRYGVMAERNIILCVGSRQDPHVNAVQSYLRDINSELKLILFNPLCTNHYIDITIGNDSLYSCVITTGEQRTCAESVRAVWYRWKPKKFSAGDSVDDAFIAKDFALEEWKNVMQSTEVFIPRALWMNRLRSVEQIQSKAFQLRLAQGCGLKIPLTKITNDSASVQSLFAASPPVRVISKPLTPLFIPPTKRVRPREISLEYVIAASSTISIFPGIFQELIERDVDLCVVVVKDVVVAARVHPKKCFGHTANKVAESDAEAIGRGTYKISDWLEKCILSFHHKAGLVFAVYDFLEVGEDEFIFLDCNPCGSWLCLDYSTGLEITRLVAEALAGITRHNATMSVLKQFENL